MKNEDIKKAWERLTPDEQAKERMLQGIMAKSAAMEAQEEASAEPRAIPWYVRLRVPMGVSAAAMACVMVVTLAVGNPLLVNNGSSRQELLGTQPVSGMHTTAPVASADDAEAGAAGTDVTNAPGPVQTTFTTMSSALTETSLDNFLNETPAVTTAVSQTPSVSEVVTSPTEAVSEPSITTAASVTTLTGGTEVQTTVQTEATVTATTVMATVTQLPSLYGDMYDFNHVTWAGLSYDTVYETVPYSRLTNHLGSGVAVGDAVNGSYTILLYEIEGVPVERGFAVQYAGQREYYYFYCVE